jgi:hypothetical protein
LVIEFRGSVGRFPDRADRQIANGHRRKRGVCCDVRALSERPRVHHLIQKAYHERAVEFELLSNSQR